MKIFGYKIEGVLIGVAGLAFLIWILIIIASGAGWNPFRIDWNFANSGAFGDSFGPINTFMASLAAIAAIAAYRIQASEIERIRARERDEDVERRRQKIEDRKQRDIERNSAEQLSFENTFFKLLEFFQHLVSSIDIKGQNGEIAKGPDAFERLTSRLEYTLGMAGGNINAAWIGFINKYKADLNHYFRTIYHLIKFIDESKSNNKYFYIRLVRALISEYELVLIALNCAHGEGREKFKPLIEKYALLHNLSQESIARWSISEQYEQSAFELILE